MHVTIVRFLAGSAAFLFCALAIATLGCLLGAGFFYLLISLGVF